MAKKVTMQQIADYLGVSKFVVSKALSGKGGVNETTKERVIEAASQLGYFAQNNAYVKKGMQLQPSKEAGSKQSVIVLMPEIRFQTKDSLYWGKVLDGILLRLEQEALSMIIISEQRMDNITNVLNPSGILGLIGVGQISTSLLLELHRIGLPMVLVDHEDPLIPTDTVFANNVDGLARLTKHLVGLGHRRLQFVGAIDFSRSFRDRWNGFRDVLEENGMETQAQDDLMLKLPGLEKVYFLDEFKGWMQQKRKKEETSPTALVCANDAIALNVVEYLQTMGIRVPEEVSVTGFDNIEDSFRISPPLTTVHVPKEMIGKRAVERLLQRIASPNDPVEKILISTEMIFRDSVAELTS